jgi:hypothetical protein
VITTSIIIHNLCDLSIDAMALMLSLTVHTQVTSRNFYEHDKISTGNNSPHPRYYYYEPL